MVVVLGKRILVNTRVLYYIPNTHILSDLFWQCDDEVPDLPRVTRYFLHWRTLPVVVRSFEVCYGSNDWRGVEHLARN